MAELEKRGSREYLLRNILSTNTFCLSCMSRAGQSAESVLVGLASLDDSLHLEVGHQVTRRDPATAGSRAPTVTARLAAQSKEGIHRL